jgi:hypothetical protein
MMKAAELGSGDDAAELRRLDGPLSVIQARSTRAHARESGAHRSLRPLPWQRT